MSGTLRLALGAVLALVFAAQPLVVYLAAYHSRDCDDKAVHFFAAMYSRASTERRAQLRAALEPFVRAHEAEPDWWRTDFRLREAGRYHPLANAAIAFFHRPEDHFAVSVRKGLLAVTVLAELAIIALAGWTPFGVFPTLLVLELIAFHAIDSTWFIGEFPRNMHPFLWYVPRAVGAVLVMPVVLGVAARRPVACVASLAVLGLLHAWLGVVCAALAGAALVGFALLTRYEGLRRPLTYGLLGLGLFGSPELRFTTCVVAGVLYGCGTTRGGDDATAFDRRALVFAALLFFVVGATSAVLSSEMLLRALGDAPNLFVVREVPARLTGVRYTLLVLGAVLAARLALRRLPERASRLAIPATLALLVIVPLANPAPYARVRARQSGFFVPNCLEARTIPLPAGIAELSLRDEPTLFLSFAQYLAND